MTIRKVLILMQLSTYSNEMLLNFQRYRQVNICILFPHDKGKFEVNNSFKGDYLKFEF